MHSLLVVIIIPDGDGGIIHPMHVDIIGRGAAGILIVGDIGIIQNYLLVHTLPQDKIVLSLLIMILMMTFIMPFIIVNEQVIYTTYHASINHRSLKESVP